MNDVIQSFSFATAGEIVFGDGTASQLPARAAQFGNRVLLVTGSKSERAKALLKGSEGAPVIFSIPGEPTVELIREGAALARKNKCDVVVAVGGGSVIDGGKAISALLTNHGDIFDYLEVIGKGFQNQEVILEVASKLVLYTDGLVEAVSVANKKMGYNDELEDFESSLIKKVFEELRDCSSTVLVKKMVENLVAFRGDDSFDDDVCMICLGIE